VKLAPGKDAAAVLDTHGAAGWETTGVAFVSSESTTVLLKRPR
jgi:hypothetical protein